MEMRLRLPELLTERELTPYAVAKQSNGRISESTLYRLARDNGRVKLFAADLCDALCDVLGITPAELFEHEPELKRGRAK